MKDTTQAIKILQAAASAVAHSGEPGSRMKIETLHNAIQYLLTGRIDGRRAWQICGPTGKWVRK